MRGGDGDAVQPQVSLRKSNAMARRRRRGSSTESDETSGKQSGAFQGPGPSLGANPQTRSCRNKTSKVARANSAGISRFFILHIFIANGKRR